MEDFFKVKKFDTYTNQNQPPRLPKSNPPEVAVGKGWGEKTYRNADMTVTVKKSTTPNMGSKHTLKNETPMSDMRYGTVEHSNMFDDSMMKK